jgi:hypothetical protein
MRDVLNVHFFLGLVPQSDASAILARHGLLELALKDPRNRNSGLGSEMSADAWIGVAPDDRRLAGLLTDLETRGVQPFMRLDREYSDAELDAAAWLVLRIATAGLYGGADFEQPYDFSGACTSCGSGAEPIGPLIAELSKMGKKQIDKLAYEQHLIVEARVVEALHAAALTGFIASPVKPRRGPVSHRFSWLRITELCRPLSSRSVGVARVQPCSACVRGGFFPAAPTQPVELRFDGPPTATDFALTWERSNGDARDRRRRDQERAVGGSALALIVSQRARRVLLAAQVGRLVWEPIDATLPD